MAEANETQRALDFIFEEVKDGLAAQLKDVDALDMKTGILIGAIGVVIAALLSRASGIRAPACTLQYVSAVGLSLLLIA